MNMLKHKWLAMCSMLAVVCIAGLACVLGSNHAPPSHSSTQSLAITVQHTGGIEVFFSPHGGCTDALVREIEHTQKSLDVHAYSFTSKPIADAIIQAHRRGVKVRVILDKTQPTAHNGEMAPVMNAGIPVWIDTVVAIAHNKVMVFDGTTISTGSFNFTDAAENHNAENLLILHDPNLAARYEVNFEHRLGMSHPAQ